MVAGDILGDPYGAALALRIDYNDVVHRFAAVVLLLSFSFALIGPAVLSARRRNCPRAAVPMANTPALRRSF